MWDFASQEDREAHKRARRGRFPPWPTMEKTVEKLHEKGFRSEPDLCKPPDGLIEGLPQFAEHFYQQKPLSQQVRESLDREIMAEIFQCPDCGGRGLPCRGPHGAD